MTALRALCVVLMSLCAPVAAVAQSAANVAPAMSSEALDRLWTVLDLPASLAIMREEGQAMADDVAESYLTGNGGDAWARDMDRIYDARNMDRTMRQAFSADFGDMDTAPVIQFFDSALGHRIITLETTARRAFLDPDTEAAAYDLMSSGAISDDRAALIQEFMDVNDLVAFNTSGALNTNFAFLSGLAEAELFRMSEADILDQVYRQVEETRDSTEAWLRAYLTMAYQPLSNEELSDYIAFSERPEGQRLNRALFTGFGEMYDMQYRELGRAVARQLSSQDL